ncbi:hypothetical protein ACH4SK_37705 [Streptomyces inhibens]|uniref:hypothetical protein n=1 Tax=Streptomyces inhibens TaxID=2293571 RepID=UPI00378943CB
MPQPVPPLRDHSAQDLDCVSALWADAKAVYLAGGFPTYSSTEWCGLPWESPLRLAAVLAAAELWRLHQAEQNRRDHLLVADPDAWFREVTADANEEARRTLRRLRLSSVPTAAEMAARRRTQPARPLRPTPGWPPLAVPGRPGHYITWHGDEHQEEAA